MTGYVSYFKYHKNNSQSESGDFSLGTRFYLTRRNKGLYAGIDLGYYYYTGKTTHLIFIDNNNTIHNHGFSETGLNEIRIHPDIGYRAIKGYFTISPHIGFNLLEYLKYSYKEFADNYMQAKGIKDLRSRLLPGTVTLYLTIGVAF